MKLSERLIEFCGLTAEELANGVEDSEVREIMDALYSIQAGKAVYYGQYTTTHGQGSTMFCLMQNYCDTKRKMLRLENMLKSGQIKYDLMMESYADLAIYSILAIQLIEFLRKRDESLAET